MYQRFYSTQIIYVFEHLKILYRMGGGVELPINYLCKVAGFGISQILFHKSTPFIIFDNFIKLFENLNLDEIF